MAFSPEHLKDELRRILDEVGVYDSDSVIQPLEASGLLGDPYGGANTAISVKAADFYEQFREKTSGSNPPGDLSKTNLLFYPKYDQTGENLLGLETWMSSTQGAKGSGNEVVTSKLAEFAVNTVPDYSGIINRGMGKGMIEGVSFDGNTGSATTQLGTSRINREMVNSVMASLGSGAAGWSTYQANNPEYIRTGPDGTIGTSRGSIRFQDLDLPKNYESHKVLPVSSTLKFMDQDSGVFLDRFITDQATGIGFFSDFQTQNNANLRANVLERLGNRDTNIGEISDVFGQFYKQEVTSGITQFMNVSQVTNNNLEEQRQEILRRIDNNKNTFVQNVDRGILRDTVNSHFANLLTEGKEYTTDELQNNILNNIDLNSYINEYVATVNTKLQQIVPNEFNQNVSSSKLNSVIDSVASEANFNYSTFDIALNRRRTEKFSGHDLNNILDTSMFVGKSEYSISEIVNGFKTGTNFNFIDQKALSQLENRFQVRDGKTMVSIPQISNGRLITNQFRTSFQKTDMNRIAESAFKSRGLNIVSNMIDQGFEQDPIVSLLETANRNIIDQDFSAFESVISQGGQDNREFFMEAFRMQQPLNITALVGKDKFKGETSLMGYSASGSLAGLNKQGVRGKQAIETLTEAVMVQGDKSYNLAKTVADITASIGNSGVIRSDFFRNFNADDVNKIDNFERARMENKMKGLDISTRNNVSGITANIIGLYDSTDPTSKKFIQNNLIGYNESYFASKGFANSLKHERGKNFNVSFDKIQQSLIDNGMVESEAFAKIEALRTGNSSDVLSELRGMGLLHKETAKKARDVAHLNALENLTNMGLFEKDRSFSGKEAVAMQNILHGMENRPMGVKMFNQTGSGMWKANLGAMGSLTKRTFGTKTPGALLSGLTFSDSFDLDTAYIDPEKGVTFKYYDFNTTTLGSKIHSLVTSYKGTLSGIMDNLTATDEAGNVINLATAGSTKSLHRKWTGGAITSLLKGAMHYSGEQGATSDFLKNLRNVDLDGNKIDLLQLLDIDLSLGGIRDKNVTDFSTMSAEEGAKFTRNLINNPALGTMVGSRKLQKRMTSAGINDPEQVLHLINRAYESSFKGNKFQRIMGRMKMNFNGTQVDALTTIGIEEFATTGADQTLKYGDAFKVGMLETRMFDSRGFSSLGNVMRRSVANKSNQFLSQVITPGDFAINSLRNSSNAMKNKLNFLETVKANNKSNAIILDTDVLRSIDPSTLRKLTDETAGMTFAELLGDGDSDLGFANIFDKQKVLSRALDTTAAGLERVLPSSIITGSSMDYFAKSINRAISGDNYQEFFEGKENLRNAFTNYTDLVNMKQLKGDMSLTDYDTRVARQQLLDELETATGKGKKSKSPLRTIISEIAESKDMDEVSNYLLFLDKEGYKGVMNARMMGGIFKDASGKEFMGSLTKTIKTVKELNEFQDYDKMFSDVRRQITDAKGSTVDIKKHLDKFGFFNKSITDFNSYDKAILNVLQKTNTDQAAGIKTLKDAIDLAVSPEQIGSLNKDLEKVLKNISQNQQINLSAGTSQADASDILNKTIKVGRKGLFDKIFKSDRNLRKDLTKKESIYTASSKVTIKNSFSGQFGEGSLIIEGIAQEFDRQLQSSPGKSLKELKAYQDMSEIFGEDVVESMVFSGHNVDDVFMDSGRYDVSKAKALRDHITSLENITLINAGILNDEASDVSKAYSKASRDHFGPKNKGIISTLGRFPLQSSEHVNTTLGFIVDSTSKGLKGNFVAQLLNKNGFDKANSGVLIGKKAALSMGADWDGDTLYNALNDELYDNDTKNLKRYIKEGSLQVLGKAGLLNDSKALKAFGVSIDGVAGVPNELRSQFDYANRYYSHMNSIIDIKLQKELEGHNNIKQVLYADSESSKVYDKYAKSVRAADGDLSKIDQSLQNQLVQSYADLRGIDLTKDKKFAKRATDQLQKEASFFNKHLFDPTADAKKAFDAANISKTGDVFSKINNIRNMEQMFAAGQFDETSLDNMFKAGYDKSGQYFESVHKIAEENLIRQMATKYDSKIQTREDLINFVKGKQNNVKQSLFASGNLYNESLELGVISSKTASAAIYSKLDDISQNIFNSKTSQDVTKYDDFLNHYFNNIDSMESITADSELGMKFTSMMEDLQSDDFLGGSFKDILQTYNEERNVSMDSTGALGRKIRFAAEISSSISNIASTSIFGDVIGSIDRLTKNKQVGKRTDYIANLMGIENKRLTSKRGGTSRDTGVYGTMQAEKTQIISKGEGSFIPESEKISITKANEKQAVESFTKTTGQTEEVIRETIGAAQDATENLEEALGETAKQQSKASTTAGAAVGQAAEVAKKAISKASIAKKGAIATGLIALGSFLGYTKGRSNIATYDEENYNEELGLGSAPGSFDFSKPNSLGY